MKEELIQNFLAASVIFALAILSIYLLTLIPPYYGKIERAALSVIPIALMGIMVYFIGFRG